MSRHGLSLPFSSMLFLFGSTLIGLAAIDAGINLLLILFGLCAGAVLLSAVSGWRGLRHLTVRRMVPDSIVAGRPFEIRYAVRNEGRWAPIRNLHVLDEVDRFSPIGAPEGFLHLLRPGETGFAGVPACARGRGRVRLSAIRLSTSFPFGIFSKSVTIPAEDELIVFPPLARLIGDLESCAGMGEAPGLASTPGRVRGDEEYYGVREYRAGDNPRRIHWRRSARTGQLMIREMSKPRDHQLWCVVDTRTSPDDAGQAERLEQAISAAATAICHALEQGSKVGLMCNGEPLLVLPPGGGRAHQPRLLRELALRAPNHVDPLAHHVQRVAWPARWRGVCLIFAATDGADLRAAARGLSRSIGPTTVLVPGTSAFEGLFAAPQADSEEWPPETMRGSLAARQRPRGRGRSP